MLCKIKRVIKIEQTGRVIVQKKTFFVKICSTFWQQKRMSSLMQFNNMTRWKQMVQRMAWKTHLC